MNLTSGQNKENSNQTDTSDKLFNVAGGSLDSGKLVSITVSVATISDKNN